MNHLSPPPSKKETVRGIGYLLFQQVFLPGVLAVVLSFVPVEMNLARINLVYYAVNFLAVLVIFRDFLMKNLDQAAASPVQCGLTVLFGLARYFVYSGIAGYLIFYIAPDFANANDAAISEMVDMDLPLMVIGTIFLVPPAEECLFRGLIFRKLYDRSRPLAYLLSAAAFSLVHLIGDLSVYSPTQLLAAFIQYVPAGLCLGWAYARSGTIFAPILIHAAINAMGIYSIRMQ